MKLLYFRPENSETAPIRGRLLREAFHKELTDCHVEYDGITAWESFRRGFALGARLVMEVVYGTEAEDG